MKKITIIGTGTGIGTLTIEAREAINEAEVLIGSQSTLEQHQNSQKLTYRCYLPDDILNVIETETAKYFVVLVSGDIGFYSAATKLGDALKKYELSYIPGVSTVNTFFARLGLPWHDAVLTSMHGRKINIVDTVRRNRMTFCLAGNNVNEIGTALTKAGLGNIKTYIGENLGMPNERVYETDAENIAEGEFPSLTVLLFINDEYNNSIRFGLPNDNFARLPGIPMTKSETRAIIISKLNLSPADICWDIGAGTGSVTVEMALCAYQGHIYAVERKADAIELIERNSASFHLGNITTVYGQAPGALEPLPAPDAVFIGGSGGNIENIISAIFYKNSNSRIVITAITPETASSALAELTKIGLEPEAVQLNVSRGKKAGSVHIMEAQNPVTIISAGGRSTQ